MKTINSNRSDSPSEPLDFPFEPLSIREMPPDERPRERLHRLGPEALSDSELLAILLRTGTRSHSALVLASAMLAAEGGLAGLASRDPASLGRFPGVGPARAAELSASLELGRRVAMGSASARAPLGSPEKVGAYLVARASHWPQERVGILVLDSRHRLVHDREIVRGSIDQAMASPRDVLRRCLLDDASSFILYHNHPSGDPSPSRDDVEFTRQLQRASREVGLRFADHVVVGREGWVSLSARGLMSP